jgi:2-iminoacetate synthase
LADAGGEQFEVGDSRSLAEVSAVIQQKGFDPVLKDWDAVFQTKGDRQQAA